METDKIELVNVEKNLSDGNCLTDFKIEQKSTFGKIEHG